MVVKTKKVKPVTEVTVSLELDKDGWKYYWNDQEVDEETYERLVKEHQEWVLEDEKKQAAVQAARQLEDKPKRKKK
jgi:biopolymer transport protein ExbD